MFDSLKNVLVLAPHTDDGELGAGGTIAKLVDRGVNVDYVAFSTAQESVPENLPRDILSSEVRSATSTLGLSGDNVTILDYRVRRLNFFRQDILEDLVKIRNANDYDLVLIPSLRDLHQDHATVAHEALRAFKLTSILGYELIWNNLSFDTTCFVKLDGDHIETKLKSLRCYESQGARAYMSRDFIYGLARARGVQIGSEFAECFEVVRWIVS